MRANYRSDDSAFGYILSRTTEYASETSIYSQSVVCDPAPDSHLSGGMGAKLVILQHSFQKFAPVKIMIYIREEWHDLEVVLQSKTLNSPQLFRVELPAGVTLDNQHTKFKSALADVNKKAKGTATSENE